jgi:hypothetical protein
LADGVLEPVGTLVHHGERLAPGRHPQVAQVHAVDRDAAARRVVDAHEQAQEGGLAGAVEADDGEMVAFVEG